MRKVNLVENVNIRLESDCKSMSSNEIGIL